ncbi:cold-shock protein [Azospirillum thermophilum]|uniref:Cold-shock protein n=1 Tax=Azospirillum thermophilum TaxID=2202148 RepID=A0A2S2CSI6_9PROT|nr:cold-shock protein [Azospirillum thermophilum]AWK87340.1 cold-shock protein [Azospirillum thermophilum]
MFDRPPRQGFRAPEITKSNVTATVKWFNPTKGFGFVSPEDGSPDAFLHVSAVQAAGYDSLEEGTTITCDLARGPKGPQVATIHSVDASTASRSARPARAAGGGSRGGYDWGDSGGEEIEGKVKWFNADKGFGFITPSTGGKDVFVHVNVLRRSGMTTLQEGDEVRVTVRQGLKGPEAGKVEQL